MHTKILEFKSKRDLFKNPVARPLDAERSKMVVDGRIIKGYPIVWGSKNDYDEIIMRGATLNSLNARGVGSTKNPILVLNQHRTSEILCRPTILKEDEYGLYFEGEIISGIQYADDAAILVANGVLRQLSYGFNYVWNKIRYDEAEEAYIIEEIKLGEISLVTFSSDENAQLRSFNEEQEKALLRKFSTEQINDLQVLLSTRGAVTNTPEENIETDKSIITIF